MKHRKYRRILDAMPPISLRAVDVVSEISPSFRRSMVAEVDATRNNGHHRYELEIMYGKTA
jgi:hypothetical protein